jgi:hypothetical protein
LDPKWEGTQIGQDGREGVREGGREGEAA